IFQTPKAELEKRYMIMLDLVHSEDPRHICYFAQKAGIEYILVHPLRRNPFELRDSRHYFKLAVKQGSVTLYRVGDRGNVPLYDDHGDNLTLDQETEEVILHTHYETGFHPMEQSADGEPARWISQDGIV